MMRGAPSIGKIFTSGTGIGEDCPSINSCDDLWRDRVANNKSIIGSLKSTQHDSEVLAQTRDEAVLSRMTQPVAVNAVREPGGISKRYPAPSKFVPMTCFYGKIIWSRRKLLYSSVKAVATCRIVSNACNHGKAMWALS